MKYLTKTKEDMKRGERSTKEQLQQMENIYIVHINPTI